ncbi:trichodiene synthase [Penicillium hispanicum]|uniref:trichodiene synthase n=1 Tax=Penicillium hispanicum TaxID=1080232 RepID=UPI002540576A|nr:trichodiene synthase [Penicillium hispanicum]KAJ5593907.1 trichodiene synthase [Penicillium hispanicum]
MPEIFPLEYFVGTTVRLFDTIHLKDTNYTRQQRAETLRYVYSEVSKHFAQPSVYGVLDIESKTLEVGLRCVIEMVVSCWVKAPPDLMVSLSIYFTYAYVLDDCDKDPQANMKTFFTDMVNGREQRHPWWASVNKHLSTLLDYYGPFCALNIYRSTVDFFEGCWIERYHFHGYYGSNNYPDFLRHLTGLGDAVGASIWPASMFDEQTLFREITTAVDMMGNWIAWTNDLISFYKEFDDLHDETTLINNYCHVENLTLSEGLEKLGRNLVHLTEQIFAVFEDKDPRLLDAMTRFMHGYATWHLFQKRYRMGEIYEKVGTNTEVGRRFRRYYEEARETAYLDPREWTATRGNDGFP